MRRPLGTGLPILLTGNSIADPIYDLSLQPASLQERMNFLTLYALQQGDGDASGNLSIIGGGAGLNLLSNSDLFDAQQAGAGPGAIKILDRFAMRGDMSVTVTNTAVPANQLTHVFGYLEIEGENDPPQALRALQPSNTLVSPYTTDPVTLNGVQSSTPVHILEEGFTDEITLFVGTGSSAASPHLVFSDGVDSIDIDIGSVFGVSAQFFLRSGKLFDGIPMLALADGAGISMYNTSAGDISAAWGYFNRR